MSFNFFKDPRGYAIKLSKYDATHQHVRIDVVVRYKSAEESEKSGDAAVQAPLHNQNLFSKLRKPLLLLFSEGRPRQRIISVPHRLLDASRLTSRNSSPDPFSRIANHYQDAGHAGATTHTDAIYFHFLSSNSRNSTSNSLSSSDEVLETLQFTKKQTGCGRHVAL